MERARVQCLVNVPIQIVLRGICAYVPRIVMATHNRIKNTGSGIFDRSEVHDSCRFKEKIKMIAQQLKRVINKKKQPKAIRFAYARHLSLSTPQAMHDIQCLSVKRGIDRY